jgi:HAD superfamily phosphatase
VREIFERRYQGEGEKPGLWQRETLLTSRQLLEELARRLPLGIVTGRPRHDAERFLESFELTPLFSAIITMEDAPLKPDPAPVRAALAALGMERAWLVGDTPDDMRAARAAGVVPIGFSASPPSPTTEQSLLRAGAARVLTDVAALAPLLPTTTRKEGDR